MTIVQKYMPQKYVLLGKNGQFSSYIFKMGENIKEKVSKGPTNVELF